MHHNCVLSPFINKDIGVNKKMFSKDGATGQFQLTSAVAAGASLGEL